MNSSNNNKQDKILIAGKDYPQTYREFVTMFPDNQSCTDFLYKLRWKDGFIVLNTLVKTMHFSARL
jgi:hypothetical protein